MANKENRRKKQLEQKLKLKAEQMQSKMFKELIASMKRVNMTFGLSDEELSDMMGDVIVGLDNPNLHKEVDFSIDSSELDDEVNSYITNLRKASALKTKQGVDIY